MNPKKGDFVKSTSEVEPDEEQEEQEDELFPGGENWKAKFQAFASGYTAGVLEGRKHQRFITTAD